MKLTPTQLAQLRVLYLQTGRGHVNLGTVKALIRKGLVRERHPGDLKSHCRMPSAYPLTDARRLALRDQDASTTNGGA